MKKIIALLLALAMCFSLCACGNKSESTPADNTNETKQPEEKSDDYISLGQELDLGFAKINFSSAELTYSVGGDGFSSIAQDGMRFFSVAGTLENTSGNNLPVESIKAEMVFNGEYTYTARATVINSKQIPVSVAPLVKAEYWIFAEIPENLLNKVSSCEVKFAINNDFASVAETVEKGDFVYKIMLGEDICNATIESSKEATDFFAECPILPTPVNYTPVRQSSSSSSSFNGKVSSIKYGFSVMLGRNDNIGDIYNTYITELEKVGFTIQNNTGNACDIYSNETKLASVSSEGNAIKFDIVPGNENVAPPSANTAEQVPVEQIVEDVLNIGDTIETDYVMLTLDDCGTDMEIRSGTSQYGSYKYYSSENGDPYFYIYGTFKNIGGTPVDIRNIYVQFCFDGKYNYKGSVDGVSADHSDFINDVSPLSSVNCYIYTAVPQELIDSYETCEVRIGFTENFDYKVIDVNDLPKFDNCDDVFCVEIK